MTRGFRRLLLTLAVLPGCGPEPPSVQDGWELVAALEGHTGNVSSLRFSPDGRFLASGATRIATVGFGLIPKQIGGELILWDVPQRAAAVSMPIAEGPPTALAFSPDGRQLACGDRFGKIRTVDVSSGRTTALVAAHSDSVHRLEYSPDGSILASGPVLPTFWHVARSRVDLTVECTGSLRPILRVWV